MNGKIFSIFFFQFCNSVLSKLLFFNKWSLVVKVAVELFSLYIYVFTRLIFFNIFFFINMILHLYRSFNFFRA